MVWQFVVLPGTHTVTVVYRVLTVLLAGPESMTTLATFVPLGGGVLEDSVPPPPPPHDNAVKHRAAHSPACSGRLNAAGIRSKPRAAISVTLRGRRRSERPGAGTPALRMRAYAPSIEPPDRIVGFANACDRCA